MTSSLQQSDLVEVLIIRQELDFAFQKPQGWDQRPLAVQGVFLFAVLQDALRQVLEPGTNLSARWPGVWFLGPDETRSRNAPACEPVDVAGGFMSVSAETDRKDRWPNEPTFVVTELERGREWPVRAPTPTTPTWRPPRPGPEGGAS